MTETMSTENQNTVGSLLKQGRLRQRLSVAECAKRTHIAPRFIEALEEEKWDVLPSESHRLGFLRLYSRFLGVAAEELLTLYKQQISAAQAPTTKDSGASTLPESKKTVSSSDRPRVRTAPRQPWAPSSIPQLIGLGIVLLIFSWIIYHVVSPRFFEQSRIPWARRRVPNEARLSVPSKTSVQAHKIAIKAVYDCWMRVTSANVLLYEGILPANASREWSGAGPFMMKFGNIKAVQVSWNDQPVDLASSARGGTSRIVIPPQ